MAVQEFKVMPNKTFSTHARAVAAVNETYGPALFVQAALRYFITCDENGRYFPVFVGEAAVHAGVHFHFNVVA